MANTPEKRDVIITLHSGKAIHSIKEMEQASRQLRKEWQMASTDEGRKKIEKELQAVNTKLKEMRAATLAASTGMEQGGKRVSTVWEKVGKVMTALSASMIAMAGFQWVTQQFRNMIQRGAELSDSLTDVQKVTGFTEAQMQKLQNNLKGMDTRTARKELLELSWAAGKLGLQGVEDVTAFVRAGDKIKVALGKDLGADAIQQIGKLVTVFQVDKKFGLEDAMIRVGSAINTLGMKSIAAEGFLVEFTKRLAGISGVADISIQDNLALAATLDNLGQTAETSSTALSKMFIKMASDAESFAKMAQMPLEEWRDLLQTDAVGALKALLLEVGQTEGGINGLAESLGDLGMDGGRVVGVLGALAKNTDLLTAQQKISNEAFKEGTSVLSEFDLKNRNIAANLEVIQKWLNQKLVSSSFMQAVERMSSAFRDYITIPVSEKLQKERGEMQSLATRVQLAGDNQKLRNRLIQELIDKYPAYFGHLNAEKASLEDISNAMRKVNEDYQIRLRLAVKEEEMNKIREKGIDLIREEDKAVQMAEIRLKLLQKDRGPRREKEYKDSLANLEAVRAKIAENEAAYHKALDAVTKLKDEEALRFAQVGADDGKAFYDAIQAEIDAKNSSKNATKELSKEEQKRIQQLIENTKKLQRELEDIHINAIADEEQREIVKLEAAHRRRQEEIDATEADENVKAALRLALADDTERRISELQEKYRKERVEEFERKTAEEIKKANDSDLLTLQLKLSLAEEGSMEELTARIALLKKNMDIALLNLELDSEQRTLIEAEYIKNVETLWQEWQARKDALRAEDRQKQLDEAQQVVQVMGQIYDRFFRSLAMQYETRLHNAQVAHERELQSMQSAYEAGYITKAAFDDQKAKKESEYDKEVRAIRRDQWEAEQNAKIAQGLIGTASAVITMLDNPWPLNLILAALVGGLGAYEVGTMSQRVNPYYAGGPTGQRTTVTTTEGQRYTATNAGSLASGGVFSSPTYGIVAEKGKELVIPNDIYTAPQYSDMMAHLEHVIARGYATGGSTTATAPVRPSGAAGMTSSAPVAAMPTGSATDAMLIEAINMNTRAVQQLMASGVRAYMEWETLTEGIYTMEQIDNRPYFDGTNRRPGQRV